MSVSINNYYNKNYYYDNSTNGGTSSTSTQSSGTSKSKNVSGTDSIDFSQVALQYFSNNKTDDSTEDNSTDTYAPVRKHSAPPLTTDRMKSLLSEIQTNVSSADSEDGTSSSTDSTLATLQDLLSDIDLSTANEDVISSLFQNIQSVPFSLAYADSPSSSETQGASGIPSMLQSMQSIAPPFMWGTAGTADTEDSSATSLDTGLTTEDIQSILTKLQSQLSSVSVSDQSTKNASNPLAVVKNMLSNVNLSSASNDDLSILFNNVLKTFDQVPQTVN
ncbi:hypothetical protein H1230_08220 [Paenibacillus sp. 19GGS1-52]|uniref:hypothetical protein n=1 Tax=Paenibacillus sp. 19GGS1-52 TaxID=2758563 RepID=UPI001EFB559F|nr:hypothetical protein [Paenibacillus sp. 19GGS1-52]ULO08757.1 hypothetical protein H1230_08220 [Paenibacillus sp. 19GGS1-52]